MRVAYSDTNSSTNYSIPNSDEDVEVRFEGGTRGGLSTSVHPILHGFVSQNRCQHGMVEVWSANAHLDCEVRYELLGIWGPPFHLPRGGLQTTPFIPTYRESIFFKRAVPLIF